MNETKNYRLETRPHPGSFVKTEIIEPLELSVTEAAGVLGITRTALSAFLNQRSSLSPDMALRIEKAFGISMELLLRMQIAFEVAEARKRAGDVDVKPYRAPAPK